MNDEKKTLGQIYFDAAYPNDAWIGMAKVQQFEYEHFAAGIAAVARHIIDEAMAKHEKECHRLRPPTVKVDDDEPAKPVSPTSGTINTGPIIACDVKQEAASKAGDWAIDAYHKARKSDTIHDAAAIIRESAERHYGKQIDMLKAVISAGKESSRIEHAKRLADRLDEASQRVTQLQGYLIALADEVGASYPSPMADETFAANIMAATIKTVQERDAAVAEVERLLGKLNTAEANLQEYRELVPAATAAAAATGEDELKQLRKDVYDEAFDALRSHYLNTSSVESAAMSLVGKIMRHFRYHHQTLFAAVRRERDEAINAVECHKSYHDTERAVKRAETAEAERDEANKKARVSESAMISSGENFRKAIKQRDDLQDKCHELHKDVAALEQRAETAEAALAKRPDERSCLAALMAIGNSLGLTGIVNPTHAVGGVEKMKAERDKLAAELGEVKGLRDAMEWSLKNTAVGWSVQNSEWEVWQNGIMIAKAKDRTDAILAAFRAKGKEPQA